MVDRSAGSIYIEPFYKRQCPRDDVLGSVDGAYKMLCRMVYGKKRSLGKKHRNMILAQSPINKKYKNICHT